MIQNQYLTLDSIKVTKIVPSTVKRNGNPVRAQVIFRLQEQIGSGKNAPIVQRSQTMHVFLEADGKYHYRNTKIVMGTDSKGRPEAKSAPVHFEFTAAAIAGIVDTPPVELAA